MLVTKADASGAAAFSVKFPDATGGAHKLIVRGKTSGQRVDLIVKVKPSISLSPKSGGQGTSFTIKLKGFEKGEVVDIKWYVTSSKTSTLKKGVVVSDVGSASVTVKVPSTATGGNHKVEADGQGASKVGTNFSVTVTSSVDKGKSEPTATPRPPRATATPRPTEVPATATNIPIVQTSSESDDPNSTPEAEEDE